MCGCCNHVCRGEVESNPIARSIKVQYERTPGSMPKCWILRLHILFCFMPYFRVLCNSKITEDRRTHYQTNRSRLKTLISFCCRDLTPTREICSTHDAQCVKTSEIIRSCLEWIESRAYTVRSVRRFTECMPAALSRSMLRWIVVLTVSKQHQEVVEAAHRLLCHLPST